MTIKGSLYLSIPVLKRFLVANKVQSKSVPEMAVFRKFKGPNIKYSHRTPKRHFLTRNDVIWRILRKYPSRGVGCSLIEEPKKLTYSPQKHGKITYLKNGNPWTDRYKILHAGCRPGRNHACQFLWRSVKGFWCGEGSNFGLFHWLASSPLKHSRTTVRVCDVTYIGADSIEYGARAPIFTNSSERGAPDPIPELSLHLDQTEGLPSLR